MENPMPCNAEKCKCNEWALLLETEEKPLKAIKIEQDKKRVRLRETVPPQHVFFTWDLHYLCNYKCTYCNALKPGHHKFIDARYIDVKQWIEIWRKVYDEYGSCEIQLTGGEPFTYPSIIDLITELSEIHTLEFSTNFSWDINPFINNVLPNRARIGISFHPEFAKFDDFINKADMLKKKGYEIWINYVAYPPFLDKSEIYREKAEKLKIHFSILPFTGTFEGRNYPAEYSPDEKKILSSFGVLNAVNKKAIDWKLNEGKNITKDKFCRMGQMYAKIYPDGTAYRCCADSGYGYLGNLIEGTFKLLDSPLICEKENCPCWRCMLVGKEEDWVKHWIIPR
jgi:MoaA/NifB/PqqE/SkfB family radical SAM enzyme